MGGVGLLIFFIIFLAIRSRGGSIELPRIFRVSFCKCLLLVFPLSVAAIAGPLGLVVVAPAIIVLLVPGHVLRWTVVPIGWPRLAYRAAKFCWPVEVINESGAGAALYAALALAHKPPPIQSMTQTIAWLEQEVNRGQPMRGAGIVAAGLLAALRGDRGQARYLFLVADTLRAKFIPMRVRAVARDWLVVDAARIGNWREVIRLGRRHFGDSLRWSYAMARMGERLSRDPRGCRDWLLWLCWLVAPRRRATFALVRRALAVPRAPRRPVAEPTVAEELPAALAKLALALEDRCANDGSLFATAVCAVDAALDRATTRVLIEQRLRALDARSDADATISSVRARLTDLVVPLIEEAPRLAGGSVRGPILDRAREVVRLRLFRDIEAQCKDYNDRQKGESSLSAIAEWATWAAMRDAANRLLELAPESEIALFHAMYVPVCNFAVFQHNKCMRRALAYEIYSWLHRHSQSDPSAAKLLLGNVRASEA